MMELEYYIEDNGNIGFAIQKASDDFVFIETDDVDVNYKIIESDKKINIVGNYLLKKFGGKRR